VAEVEGWASTSRWKAAQGTTLVRLQPPSWLVVCEPTELKDVDVDVDAVATGAAVNVELSLSEEELSLSAVAAFRLSFELVFV